MTMPQLDERDIKEVMGDDEETDNLLFHLSTIEDEDVINRDAMGNQF